MLALFSSHSDSLHQHTQHRLNQNIFIFYICLFDQRTKTCAENLILDRKSPCSIRMWKQTVLSWVSWVNRQWSVIHKEDMQSENREEKC